MALRNRVGERNSNYFALNRSKSEDDVKLNGHEISKEKHFGELQTEKENALHIFFQSFHALV